MSLPCHALAIAGGQIAAVGEDGVGAAAAIDCVPPAVPRMDDVASWAGSHAVGTATWTRERRLTYHCRYAIRAKPAREGEP